MKQFLRFASSAALLAAAALTIPALLHAQGDADKTFKTNCVLCHAADGSGNTSSGKAFKVPDLRSADVQKMSDSQISDVITQGKNKMPAFGKKLKPDNIKQLVAFIRTLPTK
jgi:mono/diheme cytochrome c family protein